jgi:hypothetical protein
MRRFALLASVAALLFGVALAEAGRIPGPGNDVFTVKARSSVNYTMTFRGGERAEIAVVGDGATDLDLYVYDENGNLIVCDEGPTDRCFVRWTPRWTGRFRIEVRNLGSTWNRYALATN